MYDFDPFINLYLVCLNGALSNGIAAEGKEKSCLAIRLQLTPPTSDLLVGALVGLLVNLSVELWFNFCGLN